MLAQGNTKQLIVALLQPNGKHGYLAVPRKCQNYLLCCQHVKVIINDFFLIIIILFFPTIGLTECSVNGVHSKPRVLSKERRLLKYLNYTAGQEMEYLIYGRAKLALICWLLSLDL